MIWDHKRMKKSMPERVIRAFMFQLLQVRAHCTLHTARHTRLAPLADGQRAVSADIQARCKRMLTGAGLRAGVAPSRV